MSSMTNPYAPPKAAVRDVFMPDETLVYADRATRLGAAILDGIIVMTMIYLPMVVVFVAVMAVTGPMDPEEIAAGTGPLPMMMLTGMGLGFVGFVAWGWLTYRGVKENGQTIAKKMLHIKVVRSDGSPASVGRIFWLRNIVNGALGIIPLYGIIELLFIFGEAQQCLHDKIADTIVVKA